MTSKKLSFINLSLKIIESKEEFEKLIPVKPKHRGNPQVIKPAELKIQNNLYNCHQSNLNSDSLKQDIFIPKCGKISNLQQFKPRNKKNTNDVLAKGYIRLKLQHNLPNPFIYELTEPDHAVIKLYQTQYNQSEHTNFKLQQKHMALIFKICQDFTHSKDDELLKMLDNQKQMELIVSNSLGSNLDEKQREILSNLVCQLFKYQKTVKKINFDQPFIRKYWPKGTIPKQLNQPWIPFKTRYPGILDPIKVSNQLRCIKEKKVVMPQTQQPMKIIESLDEWKVIYDVHCQKKKEFRKTMRNFHSLASKYGFKSKETRKNQQTEDYDKSEDKCNEETQKSRQSLLNVSSSSHQGLKWKQRHEHSQLPLFKSITEWIREKKKNQRKEKRQLNSSTEWENSQQIQDSIEIPEDVDADLSIVDEKDFNDLLFLKVQKDLQEQMQRFTLNVKEDEELDEVGNQYGSENFYNDLDWSIKEPLNFQQYEIEVQKVDKKCKNTYEVDQLAESDTTVYEYSEQYSYERPTRVMKTKKQAVVNSKKKIKRL